MPWWVWLIACGERGPGAPADQPLLRLEDEAQAVYAQTPVDLAGRVLDEAGTPIAGARVTCDAGEAVTGPDGRWSMAGLRRRNCALSVEADGHHGHVQAALLVVPVDQPVVDAGAVRLTPRDPARVRFLFAGDMALGRRYLDPDESTPRHQMPPDDPTAAIRVSRADTDAVAVVEGMRGLFATADVRILNLETPVTDDPSTPHEEKDWAFFTLPASLAALDALGVQAVALGNNHVYDYLEAGLVDTLDWLDTAAVGRAGAGLTPDEAMVPWPFEAAGTPYSLFSATTIAGEDSGGPSYVATEDKGGAADLRDTDRTQATLAAEVAAGRVPFAMLHMGNEYWRAPNDYARERTERVIEAGAAWVIAHHPHTTQGFGRVGGRLVAWSLGNFAFDQDRLETMTGYTVLLDAVGAEVERVAIVPHFIDEYRPLLLGGALADRVIRETAARCDPSLSFVADGGHGRLVEGEVPQRTDVRTVEVQIGADGFGYADLRGILMPGESAVGVEADATSVWLGRDQLLHGAFEDEDVDGETLEASRWYYGEASRVCLTGAWRGTAGLCLYRAAGHQSDATLTFRHRIRVPGDAEGTPNKDLTVLGWVRGDHAGEIDVEASWDASFGEKTFGRETVWTHPGGTFDWTMFAADIHLPPDRPTVIDPWADNARATRLFIQHSPPTDSAGRVSLDELAVVGWEAGPFPPAARLPVAAPHDFAFVRVQGTPGPVALSVTVTAPAG